jgi:hypothetical protein
MKLSKLRYISLIVLFAMLASCNKKLDVLPTSSEVDGNIISDLSSAKTALNGVYFQFANSGKDSYGVPAVLWVNLFQNVSSELSGMVVYPYGDDELVDHIYTPSSQNVDAIWNYGYKIVNAANGFLKNIAPVSHIDAITKAQMIAEAKFLRAFGNSTLLLYYGQYADPTSAYGIVLRTSFVSSDHVNQSRATVADSYAAILADLDSAIAALPSKNSSNIYANLWTAKLLKARVLMNRGATGDNAAIITLTQDIIKNAPFALEPNTKDIFLSKGFSSEEVMLGVQQDPNETISYGNNITYTSLVNEVGTDTLASLLNGDPRRSWMLTDETDPYYGTAEHVLTKYYPGDVTTQTIYPITENCYAFRLTEAYLLEAEALTRSGGDLTMAKSLLTQVLQHAGYTDISFVQNEKSADGLLLLILKENIRNFVAEGGQDWLALRRMDPADYKTIVPSLKNSALLILPIPQTEISTNSSIKQNPTY